MNNKTDKRKEAILGIQTLLRRLDAIAEHLKSNAGDLDASSERLERWKERAIRFLDEKVSGEEAEKFKRVPDSKYKVISTRLQENITRYRRALSILLEEIEDDPYFKLSPANSMPSADDNESRPDVAPTRTHSPSVIGVQTAPQAHELSTDARRNVFVVHGRNLEARNSLFRFLRSIGLRPLEWSQAIKETDKASPFIGEILDVAFAKAQAIVVLMTPDDVAQLQEPFRSPQDPPYESQLTGQARPNVLFEAGMAMGRDPDRTIIVELGAVRLFSDIAGRHTVRLSNDSAARQELAQRLETAGCSVDLTGRDWHTEGDFTVSSSTSEEIGVRFDGLYHNGSEHYLRFYEDGTVISVSAFDTPKEVALWFRKEREDISKGRYKITGHKIKFSTTNSSGTLEQEGVIEGMSLALKWYSDVLKKPGVDIFRFNHVDELG